MTCLGWPFTTLAKALACCGGQGGHITEGHHVMTNGEGRVQEGEKREQFTPPLLSNKNSGF